MMRAHEKKFENICVITGGGLAYTVDEVSDVLEVPRPTLYRYLREYSIPHLRRSGKIYVPEESFDQIKEVRELHKEGLATESVRKRLQEESNFDVDELMERMDRISEALESLQRNPKPANGAPSAQALQAILERQDLLVSAVFNLTEMLEEFLHANGQSRKVALSNPEEETREQKTLSEQLQRRPETIADDPTANEALTGSAAPEPTNSLSTPTRRRRFGVMARRRRGIALVVLLALLTGTALTVYALSAEEYSGASQEEVSQSSQETSVGSEEDTAGSSDAAPPAPADGGEEAPTGYAKEGHENSDPEQPLYQTQYPAPGPLPQEQPILQPQQEGARIPPPLQ